MSESRPSAFERTLTTLRILQDEHAATVEGYEVEPDGAVTFDVTLSRFSVCSLRARFREDLARQNLFQARVQREWCKQVAVQTARVRRIYEKAA
jgi:hypothetical protein